MVPVYFRRCSDGGRRVRSREGLYIRAGAARLVSSLYHVGSGLCVHKVGVGPTFSVITVGLGSSSFGLRCRSLVQVVVMGFAR
jgi:hypothetical protein